MRMKQISYHQGGSERPYVGRPAEGPGLQEHHQGLAHDGAEQGAGLGFQGGGLVN